MPPPMLQAAERQEAFLRLSPSDLLAADDSKPHAAVLYRWLKTALSGGKRDYDLDHLDFDRASFRSDRDLDAVLLERMRAYVLSGQETRSDPFWYTLVTMTLRDRIGIRFTETVGRVERHFYVFPSCVFVSEVHTPGVAGGAGTVAAAVEPDPDELGLSEDARNQYEADRRAAAAYNRRLIVTTKFYGFSVSVRDGTPLTQLASTLHRAKGGAMGATDDSTRFHYLELLQHHKALPGTEAAGVRNAEYPVSRSLDTQVNGKPVPVGVLEGTSGRTSLKDKAKAVAARIKRDLKKLLTKSDPVADTVRVELGNSQARQKSLFEVKYSPSDVNALKMQAAAQTKKAPTRYGLLRKREQALNAGQDADTLIDKQINETLIVSYLLDTSDRARFKQIVCRYRHLEHDDDRHVVYTIPVDGYGKRTGTAITAMALHNVRESLDVMYVTVHAVDDYSEHYLVTPDTQDGAKDKPPSKLAFRRVDADDHGRRSSFETDPRKAAAQASKRASASGATEPIRTLFQRAAQGSTLLQFLTHIYVSAVRSEMGHAHYRYLVPKGGAGTFHVASSRNARYVRFNNAFHFVHMMACASHQFECLTCAGGKMRKGWFGSKQGTLLNLVCAAKGSNVQVTATFPVDTFTASPTPVTSAEYVKSIIRVDTRGWRWGNRPSVEQSLLTAPATILNTVRQHYRAVLGNLGALLERGDYEEFFYLMRRRDFWLHYAKHLQLVHGYAFKEVVAPQYHDVFLQELFYHQLRTAWAASANRSASVGDTQRIPTFIADGTSDAFRAVIHDAHRTIFALKGMNTHTDPEQRLKHVANLLQSFGRHQSTAAEIALSADAARVDTNELEMETDQEALRRTIEHLKKQYNITDPMLVIDLQQKNAQLLFHFLHFVENNGTLDTLGHLHVSFGHLRQLQTVIEHVAQTKADDPNDAGVGQTQGSWWSRRFAGKTNVEAIARRFFSLEPYLTLDPVLVQHMQKTDDFRYMLQDWQYAERLMFIRVHAHTHGSGLFQSQGKQYKHLDLYAFLPTYVYLTREARNLLQRLTDENRLKQLVEAIKTRERKGGGALVPTKAMTPDERREFDDRREQNLILHGLLYFMKQQLVESSGTNVFLLHMHNQRGGNAVGTAKTQQLWLFGQWHRQYILYDLKHYISNADTSGLRSVQLSPDSVEHEQRRIYNLLDDRLYETPADMEEWLRAIRNAVTGRLEAQTTVKEEATRRSSRAKRASRRRRSLEGTAAHRTLRNTGADPDATETAIVLGEGAVERKQKMLAFVELIQTFVTKGRVGHNPSPDGIHYPTTDIMWLLFCELYTFTPGMYNHILAMVHYRLRKCEDAAMLSSGGLFNDVLTPTTQAFSLYERNLHYYVSVNAPAAGTSRGGKEYLLQLDTDTVSRTQAKDIRKELASWSVLTNTTHAGAISTRLMLSMLVDHVGLLSRATGDVTDPLDTELAEVQCLSWPRYLAKKKARDWTDPESALPVSLVLNGLFATHAALRGFILPLITYCMPSPVVQAASVGGAVASTARKAGTTAGSFALSSALGGVGHLALWLAKSVLSKAASTVLSPVGLGMGLGVLLAKGGVSTVVKEAMAIVKDDNPLARFFISGASAAQAVSKGVAKSTGVQAALHTLSAYLLCNTRILNVKTKFRLNNVFYKWEFDLAVDVTTGQILMYYGIDEKNIPKQIQHKTYAEAFQALRNRDNKRRYQSMNDTVHAIKTHKLQAEQARGSKRRRYSRRSTGRRARPSQRAAVRRRFYGGRVFSKKNRHRLAR